MNLHFNPVFAIIIFDSVYLQTRKNSTPAHWSIVPSRPLSKLHWEKQRLREKWRAGMYTK